MLIGEEKHCFDISAAANTHDDVDLQWRRNVHSEILIEKPCFRHWSFEGIQGSMSAKYLIVSQNTIFICFGYMHNILLFLDHILQGCALIIILFSTCVIYVVMFSLSSCCMNMWTSWLGDTFVSLKILMVGILQNCFKD